MNKNTNLKFQLNQFVEEKIILMMMLAPSLDLTKFAEKFYANI
jgi:hypothetical protein